MGLRDAGGHGAHTHLGDQLHVDPADRIGVLEVVDELGQVLDGVDVVVGWRGDQPHARRGVAGTGDPGVHLVARQLATFARLGPLGHLDLEVVAVDQVLARHPEASRGHLLDGRPPEVAVGLRREPVGVLAPLTGVGPAADAVHGYGERLVGLGADRAVGHRSGGEAADYRRHRLHLVDRHGWLTVLPEVEHSA